MVVTSEERHSNELGKRFVHTKLQLQSTEDGPTEIGGLMLDPAYRRHKEMCGKALSTVRFAYMSFHPQRFEREVLAEMLSPFTETGGNLLWDAFGARFTGLPYRDADHLSGPHQHHHRSSSRATRLRDVVSRARPIRRSAQQTRNAKAALRILEDRLPLPSSGGSPRRRGPNVGAARDADHQCRRAAHAGAARSGAR